MDLFDREQIQPQSNDIPEHIHDKIGFLLHREFMGDQKIQGLTIGKSDVLCSKIFTEL